MASVDGQLDTRLAEFISNGCGEEELIQKTVKISKDTQIETNLPYQRNLVRTKQVRKTESRAIFV